MSEEISIPLMQIATEDWENTPVSVKALVLEMTQSIEQLKEQIAQLQEQVNRNPGNSSQAPSQAGEKGFKAKAKAKSGKKRGAQLGHEGHQQLLYAPEACQSIEEHYPDRCCDCGRTLVGEDPEPQRVQTMELPMLQPIVVEHRFHALACADCGTVSCAFDAKIVNGSRYGARLTAFVGLLSGEYRQSHRMVERLLNEVFGMKLCIGSIGKLRAEISESVASAVQAAQVYVQQQPNLGSDETGFRQGNVDGNNPSQKRGWLWVLVTPYVCYFQVFLSRSQAAAQTLLGATFSGNVVTDRYSAYSWLDIQKRQVCWSHLKRDFTKISERIGLSAILGQSLLEQQRKLFEVWHQARDGIITRAELNQQMLPIRAKLQELLQQGAAHPITQKDKSPLAKTVRTCRQLLKVEPALWLFVSVEGVEPTNNASERALRPAVLWRRSSLGTQSQDGSLFVSRLLTVVTSLRLQQRNVLDYLTQACQAKRQGQPAPSLLPVASIPNFELPSI
jgi:IS1 family transposase